MTRLLVIESRVLNGIAPLLQLGRRHGHEVILVTVDGGAYFSEASELRLQFERIGRVVECANARGDARRLVEAALSYVARHGPVDAVFTLSEAHLPIAAEVAQRLGTVHCTPQAAASTRSKLRTRQALTAAGLKQPRFLCADTAEAGLAAVRELGLPAIVKPVDGYGSQLARRVDTPDSAAEAVAAILQKANYGRGVDAARLAMVEEFLDGPIVSAEVLSRDGIHHILGFTDRIAFADGTFGERGGSFPAAFRDAEAAERTVADALDAVGFTDSAAHVELCLSASGPVVIEINGRLAGFLVPELIEAATGIDVYAEVARLHLGQCPSVEPRFRRQAHIRSIFADRSGVLEKLAVGPAMHRPEIIHFRALRAIGDHVDVRGSNHDRIGAIIAASNDAQVARRAIEQAVTEVRVDIRPAPVPKSGAGKPAVLWFDRRGYRSFLNADGECFLDRRKYAISLVTPVGGATGFDARKDDIVLAIDFDDQRRLRKIASDILSLRPHVRIFAFTERLIEFAAELREAFDIPGMRLPVARQVRDKVLMKEAVQRAGLATPRCVECPDRQGVRALLSERGAAILKPRSGMGAIGVRRIRSLDEYDAAVCEIPDIESYECEEFIDGPMFHVDSIVKNGCPVFAEVSEFVTQCIAVRRGKPVITMTVPHSDLRSRLMDNNAKVIAALGIDNAVTHHELFLTESGEIVMCEIAGRPGGGLIKETIWRRYGINPYEVMIALELGEDLPPLDMEPRYPFLANVLVYENNGVREHLPTEDEFDEPWILSAVWPRERRAVTDESRMYGDYLAAFIIAGDNRQQTLERIEAITARFRSDGAPVY